MFEKQGKFYADWRDRKGNRKRKSFTSARLAPPVSLLRPGFAENPSHPSINAENAPAS
jgi:hypothetical protein